MTYRIETRSIYAPITRRQKGLLSLLVAFNATWRQRKALSELEPHLLRDIGITDSAAKKEASRPIWDIPSHWRL